MALRFRRLQSRINTVFVTLLVGVLLLVVVLVDRANTDNARDQIFSDIQSNARIFAGAVDETSTYLLEAARLLSSDYAFKRVYSTHDTETIVSAMRNHLGRLEKADIMLLLDIDDGSVLADTRDGAMPGQECPFPELLMLAEQDDFLEAHAFVSLDDTVHQVVVVPLLLPDVVAWFAIGFRIDDAYVEDFRSLSRSHISLFSQSGDHHRLFASTLSGPLRRELDEAARLDNQRHGALLLSLEGEEYVTAALTLEDSGDHQVVALLQRSLDEALRPYQRLKLTLLIVFVLAIVVAMLGSNWLSRRIARPVLLLANHARRVERGDYTQTIAADSHDEVGQLAQAFNGMTRGLAERDRVQKLLGKVVSPQIAHELLQNGVELGGEEKEVSVLFSDLRNFTALCEGREAREILSLLNIYLNEMSGAVEEHQGVVDKYIGDALMALFGAPFSAGNDAANAVATALSMKALLQEVNRTFAERGLPAIDIGIGINTDVVVAGNMGSANRLNYTVIGDGVNLASRLEGLTKFYGLKILVSESTRQKADSYHYREIDRVRVKGKQQPVVVYEPFEPEQEAEIAAGLNRYVAALEYYKLTNWRLAAELFGQLSEEYPDQKVYQVYHQRCLQLQQQPPGEEWDGVYSFTSK